MAVPNVGNLQRGSRGGSVEQLQRILAHGGFYTGAIDGLYGPKTQQAVQQFQQYHGLEPDGVVGSNTNAKLAEFGRWGGRDPNADQQAPQPLEGVESTLGGGGGGQQDPITGEMSPEEATNLGPVAEQEIRSAKERIDLEHRLAKEQIQHAKGLSRQEKERALEELAARRTMKLRALGEKFGDVIEKQPEQFAARGLLRSGLLQQRFNKLQEKLGRQQRDIKQGFGLQEENIQQEFQNRLKELNRKAQEARARKKFGLKDLKKNVYARRTQLASELEELGQPIQVG